jgi:Tfp pilus assembly protein PilP
MAPRRAVMLFSLIVALGCGEDEQPVADRGLPSGAKKMGKGGDAKKASRRTGKTGAPAAAGAEAEEEGEEEEAPKRPSVALDSKSFGRRRDPFQRFVAPTEIIAEPDRPRAERKVKMATYAFEDLKLIAIVNSGRGIRPRALFLASDGKSKTIQQGEYFSTAEVLLAAVNRDYVEIEVVDDDLASSLNLQRGERRALYLKTD